MGNPDTCWPRKSAGEEKEASPLSEAPREGQGASAASEKAAGVGLGSLPTPHGAERCGGQRLGCNRAPCGRLRASQCWRELQGRPAAATPILPDHAASKSLTSGDKEEAAALCPAEGPWRLFHECGGGG